MKYPAHIPETLEEAAQCVDLFLNELERLKDLHDEKTAKERRRLMHDVLVYQDLFNGFKETNYGDRPMCPRCGEPVHE